jgi:hypothetical protein
MAELETEWAAYGPSDNMFSSVVWLVEIMDAHVMEYQKAVDKAGKDVMDATAQLMALMYTGLPKQTGKVDAPMVVTKPKPVAVHKKKGQPVTAPLTQQRVPATTKPKSLAVRKKEGQPDIAPLTQQRVPATTKPKPLAVRKKDGQPVTAPLGSKRKVVAKQQSDVGIGKRQRIN